MQIHFVTMILIKDRVVSGIFTSKMARTTSQELIKDLTLRLDKKIKHTEGF